MIIQPRFHPVRVPLLRLLLLRPHGAGAGSFHGVCCASLRLAGAGFPPGPVPLSVERDSVRDPPLFAFLPRCGHSAKPQRRGPAPELAQPRPSRSLRFPGGPCPPWGPAETDFLHLPLLLAGELSGSQVAKARRDADRRWGALWAESASLGAQR